MTPPLKMKRRASDPLRKGGKPPPTKTTTATAALTTDSMMNTAYNLCISEALEIIMQHDVFTSISTRWFAGRSHHSHVPHTQRRLAPERQLAPPSLRRLAPSTRRPASLSQRDHDDDCEARLGRLFKARLWECGNLGHH